MGLRVNTKVTLPLAHFFVSQHVKYAKKFIIVFAICSVRDVTTFLNKVFFSTTKIEMTGFISCISEHYECN